MAATNNTNSNKKYYKLKEDKRDDSPSKGEMRFFEQTKTAEGWKSTSEFNSISGYIHSLSIKEYEYEGEKKENLVIELLDDEDDKSILSITLGFNSFIAQNILNTIAGEAILGVFKFRCGKPSEKGYPTLWINNNGQKTKWKYSKENNNIDEIPKVITSVDEDHNKIKKGVKANTDFWKGVLAEISKREQILGNKKPAPPTNNSMIEGGMNDANDDLPF